jgi:hypothetical protein
VFSLSFPLQRRNEKEEARRTAKLFQAQAHPRQKSLRQLLVLAMQGQSTPSSAMLRLYSDLKAIQTEPPPVRLNFAATAASDSCLRVSAQVLLAMITSLFGMPQF